MSEPDRIKLGVLDPERAAKRQKRTFAEEEDETKPKPVICCKICETDLGKDNNDGEGYRCSYCDGNCEISQVCSDQ